jgi:poly(3-hydroxybutyrate) depolymerase
MTDRSPLAGLTGLGSLQPLKPLRRPPVRMTGPRQLRLDTDPERVGGPGEPPVGFVTAHTSKTEWVAYWALAKVERDPPDPRKPPYVGGANWTYQKAIDGGRVVGGQVVDFVYVHPKGKTIGIRIQTEHWHLMTDAATQMADFFLKTHQRAVDQFVDVFDTDLLRDKHGKSACVAMANAIKGIGRISPLFAGDAERLRKQL